jgi:hypothetical protein
MRGGERGLADFRLAASKHLLAALRPALQPAGQGAHRLLAKQAGAELR